MLTDFLIIGQGLAGSLLAWELIRRDYKVMVVDNGKHNASQVAAGIINPVTGIRLAKTPDVAILLPAALSYYAELSAFFGERFFYEKPVLRLLQNESELAYAKQRVAQKEYQPYLGKLKQTNPLIDELTAPCGWLEQKQTGHVLTEKLLSCLKKFLIDQNAYRQAALDYQSLCLENGVTWRDITAKRLIFCEGYLTKLNPWLSWLPMQPAKGEILTLETQQRLPDAILNFGNWLLPLTPGKVRLGATFERESYTTQTTEQGKLDLLNSAKAISHSLAQAKVTAHHAGIRPCTADKFPFIGIHPKHAQIAIFNGFGSKGCLQMPWYCQRFADFLQHGIPLPANCDIQRYHASHFPG